MKKIRAPRQLKRIEELHACINLYPSNNDGDVAVYIRRDATTTDRFIYNKELPLTESQVIRLAKWLNKAAEFFKARGEG